MKSDFLIAITQLATERRLPREVVLSAIEAALVSAFKKDTVGANQNISVKISPATGEVKVYVHKVVVEHPEDINLEISLAEARQNRSNAELGETVEIEETPHEAGRIAAQTAKQVIIQRLREAERDVVYEEYASRVNELLTGVVQKVEPYQVIVNLGRTEAALPATEQVPGEHYRPGQRLRVLLTEVQRGAKGPQVIVSRAHRDLLRRLFELEVPEILTGTVVIRSIAREPGYRSKVAVEARQEGVDPVGSCVGLRGVRIQNIVNELQGEKIDVIQWNRDPTVFIAHALSPSQVQSVRTVDEKTAVVIVPDRQLSLAIGREGQNARLAAKLTGWRIDIRSASEALAEEAERTARGPEQAAPAAAIAAQPAQAPALAQATLTPALAVASAPTRAAATAPTPAVAAAPAPRAGEAAVPVPAQATAQAPAGPGAREATPATQTAAAKPAETAPDLTEQLRALEASGAPPTEAAEGEPEEAQRFDFDAWLQQFQSQTSGQIRFAEDIFPERGSRFKEGQGGRDRGARRAPPGRRSH
ncbi:MAG: transcription termination/antitermination protein NusA [Chloroflexi bacterium]|nr:transcription termination/antitermination protein NusA [Chloroflexota bacterium]